MGFFSDLKEDLSQAVNELMPDEEQAAADAGQEKELRSLDEMLQNIDSIQVPEDLGEAEKAEDSALAEEYVQASGKEAEEQEGTESVPGLAEDSISEEDQLTLEKQEETQEPEEAEDMDLESMLAQALGSEIEKAEEREEKGAEKKMDIYEHRTVSDETSVITAGMTINGDITSEGSLDVIGSINGNIDILGKLNITGHITGNSKASEIYAESAKINGEVVSDGAVKIGASSVIIGNITAKSAAIAGAVKGDIDVQGPVILDASAIVMGNIKSKSVQINNGAVIEGMCSQCYAEVSPTSFFDEYKLESKKPKQK